MQRQMLEVEDPPGDGDRLRRRLRRQHHHRPGADGEADLLANEQVHVWDIDNGARFVTYVIEGEPRLRRDAGERRRRAPRQHRATR